MGGTALALAALLAACSVGPDYVQPVQPVPQAFVQPSDQTLPRPTSDWWRDFGSAELNALIEDALTHNHDVRIAMHRIAQAEARAGVEAGALLPLVQGSAEAQARRRSLNTATAPTDDNRFERDWQAGLEVSYEVDLWGKNRSAMDAAMATAHASVFQREVVALTLIGDVATAYLGYLHAWDRVEVARGNVENMERVLEKVVRRQQVGEGSSLEIQQQNAALANARATLPILELDRDLHFHRLAILVGRAPSELKIEARSLQSLRLPAISPGLPSELLLRRPDIRKAEADLVAANSEIGAASAKLFPSLNLTADLGLASEHLHNFFNPTSLFWTLGAKLAQTLFDNGKTNSEIAYRQARWNEMVETYRKTIVTSFAEVENALASVRHYEERDRRQAEMVVAARAAYALSQRSFTIGVVDYLTVLETERTQYNAEDGMIRARFDRLAAAVALYKALGGGAEPVAEERGNAE